jgi:hypothetical protein
MAMNPQPANWSSQYLVVFLIAMVANLVIPFTAGLYKYTNGCQHLQMAPVAVTPMARSLVPQGVPAVYVLYNL